MMMPKNESNGIVSKPVNNYNFKLTDNCKYHNDDQPFNLSQLQICS